MALLNYLSSVIRVMCGCLKQSIAESVLGLSLSPEASFLSTKLSVLLSQIAAKPHQPLPAGTRTNSPVVQSKHRLDTD